MLSFDCKPSNLFSKHALTEVARAGRWRSWLGKCYAACIGLNVRLRACLTSASIGSPPPWASVAPNRCILGRTAEERVEATMSELLALAGINVTVTVAFAAFIWRNQVQAERRNDAAHAGLSRRIDHLAESVGSRIEGLTAEVSGLGQRLARLEGWIERDRVGQEQS